MKFILSVTAPQAMSLRHGTGPSVSSRRSHFSNGAGIAFSSAVALTLKTDTDIRRMDTMEGESE